MNKLFKRIHDTETNEILDVEFTKEEYEIYAANQLQFKNFLKTETDKLAAKQSAQAKLAALGLTADEVTAIIGA